MMFLYIIIKGGLKTKIFYLKNSLFVTKIFLKYTNYKQINKFNFKQNNNVKNNREKWTFINSPQLYYKYFSIFSFETFHTFSYLSEYLSMIEYERNYEEKYFDFYLVFHMV